MVTTVVESAGGVGEGEWFGGAAVNTCSTVVHSAMQDLHSLPELLFGSAGGAVWRSCNEQYFM